MNTLIRAVRPWGQALSDATIAAGETGKLQRRPPTPSGGDVLRILARRRRPPQ
ncbi:hypothetical protein GU243_14670 [Pseudarthrobacter psychrotolerans]|uniref:Uncharacterized protein n=1 Tax=Pseudarthrobacter psychrotolerans TaxID=2697569 RepID=A0A6P1NK59_9MICC|nr:hypothetical protein GU243_14670 [Pseudarthrobacter psychrotolerans]